MLHHDVFRVLHHDVFRNCFAQACASARSRLGDSGDGNGQDGDCHAMTQGRAQRRRWRLPCDAARACATARSPLDAIDAINHGKIVRLGAVEHEREAVRPDQEARPLNCSQPRCQRRGWLPNKGSPTPTAERQAIRPLRVHDAARDGGSHDTKLLAVNLVQEVRRV